MTRSLKILVACLLVGLPIGVVAQESRPAKSPYPIIFIHGLDSDSETWTATLAELSRVWNLGDSDRSTFHAVLNAQAGQTHIFGEDRVEGTLDDDVLIPHVNPEFPSPYNHLSEGSLYACNFGNFWYKDGAGIPWLDPFSDDDPGGLPQTESKSNQSAMAKQGYAVGKCIDAVLETRKGEPQYVILVGHSMGGLAAREYLQSRHEDGTPRWWNDDTGHRVARLITIGTPHRGSNLSVVLPTFGLAADWRSEAVRDLRYRYLGFFTNIEGIFLYGGTENDEFLLPLEGGVFHNTDINADGDAEDFILGLNYPGGSSIDNPAQPLPRDVWYTWITSRTTLGSLDGTGDGVVGEERQWLFDGETGAAWPLGISERLRTDQHHLKETEDLKSFVGSLDVPGDIERSYEIRPGEVYSGYMAQAGGEDEESDYYRIRIPGHSFSGGGGRLQLTLTGTQSGVASVSLHQGRLESTIDVAAAGNSEDFPLVVSGSVFPGDVFVEVRGHPTPTTWRSPYNLTATYVAKPLVTSVNPTEPMGSDTPQRLVIVGSGFSAGAAVKLFDNGQYFVVTDEPVTDAGETSLTIYPEFGEGTGPWAVEVINPDGQSSGQFEFWVSSPVVAVDYADLEVESVSVPTTARAGASIDISFSTKNSGSVASSPTTTVVRIGSPGGTKATDPQLAQLSEPEIAAAGAQGHAQTLTIPTQTTPGEYKVWIVVDNAQTGGQSATGEANDITGYPITILPPETAARTLTADPAAIVTELDQNASATIRVTLSVSGEDLGPWTVDMDQSWVRTDGGPRAPIPAGESQQVPFLISSAGLVPGSYVSTATIFETVGEALLILAIYLEVTEDVTQDLGSITVSLLPQAAVDAGAQWKIVDHFGWKESGTTYPNLPFGTYTIEYRAIPYWLAPPSVEVTIEPAIPHFPLNSAPFTYVSSDDLVISDGLRFLTPPPYLVNTYAEVTATILNNSATPITIKRVQVDGSFVPPDGGSVFTRNWRAVDLNPPVALAPGSKYVYLSDNSGDVFPGIPASGTAALKVVVEGTPGLQDITAALPTATADLTFDVVAEPREFTIRTDVNPPNGGTAEGAGTYMEGTPVALRAVPSAGFVFSKWIRHLSIYASDTAEYSFDASYSGLLIAHFVSTPDMVSPTNEATGVSPYPSFYWTGGGSWESFDFQLATDASFTENLVEVTGITERQHSERALSPNTVYFWRVRAAGISSDSEWSASFKLTTGVPSSELIQSPQKISDVEGGFEGQLNDGDAFGHSVTSIGDLDGDGVVDLAVGAPRDDNGLPNQYERGAVWVLFMNSHGTVKSHRKISSADGGFQGEIDHQDLLGSAVAGIGDLDLDGNQDLAVGAPGNGGAVWILFLNADGTVGSHQEVSASKGGLDSAVPTNFGTSVASAGDIDRDGIADLIVGSQFGTTVWILFMNRDGTVRTHQEIGASKGGFQGQPGIYDYFGHAVTGLGELEGRQTVAIGVPRDGFGGTYKGSVWILGLNADGSVHSQSRISNAPGELTGGADLWEFGWALANAGDVNGDQIDDLIVGTGNYSGSGAAFILTLSDAGSQLASHRVADENAEFGHYFGAALVGLGDLDADGISEFVSGEASSDDGGQDRGAVWVIRGPSGFEAPSSPTAAVTDPVRNVTFDSAELLGTVNPNRASTVSYFEYGTSDTYGSLTVEQDAGEGSVSVPASSVIYGLKPGTLYHYRLSARNVTGVASSADQIFSTPNLPTGAGQKLLASDGGLDDTFGASVAASGSRAAISSSNSNGAVYVFHRESDEWVEENRFGPSSPAFDGFGESIDIDDDLLIVGAPRNDDRGNDAGAAYIYHYDQSSWQSPSTLSASQTAGDLLGTSVSISGDLAVVGSPGNHNWSGETHVFTWDGLAWSKKAQLSPAGLPEYARFGNIVKVAGDVIVVGASGENGSTGAAYVFRWDGTQPVFESRLVPLDAQENDSFGQAVAVSDDVIVIGAPQKTFWTGAAYVFRRIEGEWVEEAKIGAPDLLDGDSFGNSVAIQGPLILIGTGNRNAAYLFRRSGQLWKLDAEMAAPDRERDDRFGSAVALGESFAVVGSKSDKVGPDWARGSAWVVPIVIQKQSFDLSRAEGWNLVGSPTSPSGRSYRDLFPDALDGSLFGYTRGYVQPPEGRMHAGFGYWLRFPVSGQQTMEDDWTSSVTIPLHVGWNLISPPNCTIPAGAIVDGGAIVTPGTLFGYSGAYTLASELLPGSGYWIRASAAGTIGMDCAGRKTSYAVDNSVPDWHPVSIGDQMVYLGAQFESNIDPSAYSVPPAAPNRTWQAMFADGRYVAETGGAISLIGAEVPLRVSGDGVTAIVRGQGGLILKSVRLSGSDRLVITDPSATVLELTTEGLPNSFTLDPAYPTPFNPKTTVGFSLPAESIVSLTVFDVLGRRVATLIDRKGMVAGRHEVIFDGSGHASGIYMIRLSAGPESRVRQLVLRK